MANEMRDRLVELMEDIILSCKSSLCVDCEHLNVGYPHCMGVHFADRLLDDGWVRPPMKLGQICFKPWYSAWSDEVRQYRVSSITQKADGSFKIRLTDLITKSVFEITPDKIGEKLFLTKAEAEQKLKEMRGADNG